jgi:hypothetical protein
VGDLATDRPLCTNAGTGSLMHDEHGMRAQPRVALDMVQGGYSLRVEHPRSGTKAIEIHASLSAVVPRATELIQAGYSIGISSAASLEAR